MAEWAYLNESRVLDASNLKCGMQILPVLDLWSNVFLLR